MVPWLAALRGPPAGSSLASGQRIYRVMVGAGLHGLVSGHGPNALSPCWGGGIKAIIPVAINNRLRTGTDKGNPTV